MEQRSKRIVIGLVASVVLTGAAFAGDVIMPAFSPRSPVVMAQGESFTAVANGYESLFTNPAGFANPKGSFTLLSVMPWVYGNPRDLLVSAGAISAPSGYEGPTTTFDTDTGVADYLEWASKGGVGMGVSAGLGYVGKGLGLGLITSSELFMFGTPFPAGVSGYVLSDFAIVAGLAFTPIKSKFVTLSIGGDLRPSIRLFAPVDAESLLEVVDSMNGNSDTSMTAALNQADMYQGAGLGLDAGAKLGLGDFTLSLTLRDIFGTRYMMRQYGLGDWLEEVDSSGSLPDNGNSTDDTYIVPMNFIIGGAYHLDLGRFAFFIDPTFHAELSDPISVFTEDRTPWALLHFGTEVKIFRFLKLRGGIDQGYLTAGAGVRLLFLDANIAIFTRELGRYAGDTPSSGVSAEVAIRF